MRFSNFLLPIVASAATTRLAERQEKGSLGAMLTPETIEIAYKMLPRKKAMKIEEIPTQLGYAGSKRMKIIYGPYTLKAANSTKQTGNGVSMDTGGTAFQNIADDDFPRDITALDTYSEVQLENFKRAETKDGIYNHHNIFMDLAKPPGPPFACTNGKPPAGVMPLSIFAAGATEDTRIPFATPPNSTLKTGFYLSKDRRIMNALDVINYNNVEKKIYVSLEIEYLPGKQSGFAETRLENVDPGLCGSLDGRMIHPPKGQTKFSVNSTGIIIAKDGYIISARGHLHDGGVNILLKLNDKLVCDSKAIYGGEGHEAKTADGKVWKTINTSSTCWDHIKVKKGDSIYMEANYDVVLHPPREQGHGGMMMGPMKRSLNVFNDEGHDAEQMALFVLTYAYPI